MTTADRSPGVPPATLVLAAQRAGRKLTTTAKRAAHFLLRHEDSAWVWAARTAAVVPLVALVLLITVLAWKAWPAIEVNGLGFLTHSKWDTGNLYGAVTKTHGVSHPTGASYGAWPLIAGTLESSGIALVIALPVSIGAAFAMTERMPRAVSRVIGFFVELLAGVPSVIIGLWGALTLGPLLARDVYPIIARHAPQVPVLRYLRGPTGVGEGLLTSSVVLALMIVPIIAATTRDLLKQVPDLPKEGARALGMTDWEVARRVTLPWVKTGVVGATVLGLGRALGETMAVAMVTGVVLGSTARNVYGTMTTIAATIVSQLDASFTDATGFAVRTLAEAALVLAVITLLVNVGARLLVRRSAGTALPVGRGI